MHYFDRRNPRLKKHDYRSPTDYFVTICTHERRFIFGEIVNFNPDVILGEALIPDPRIETESNHEFNINAALKAFPDVITKYHPGDMKLSAFGKIVDEVWKELPKHFQVYLTAYQIMPNHLHLTLTLENLIEDDACVIPTRSEGGDLQFCDAAQEASYQTVGTGHAPSSSKQTSLGNVIGSFKSEISKRIHEQTGNDQTIWQTGYYDHIIRSYDDYKRIRNYIVLNPKIWFRDRNNPNNFNL
ncbi:MAG: hypothetical protein NT141_00215 [candidate division WWE3 bacterium]|nr:hypothetical protein [candidate division WWE3 bacterium]